MQYNGFVGQSYVSSSPSVDCERSMNVYPEVINAPGVTAKSKLVLRRRPGLNLLQTLADSNLVRLLAGPTHAVVRGLFAVDGRVFAVVGATFYELISPTTPSVLGSFASASYNSTAPVQWACNSTQILILADGLGYVFTLATGAFAQITGQAGFPANAVSCTAIDTYFIVLGSGSNQFAISGLLDGLTWSGLDFSGDEEPDNAVALANLHGNLWIFGGQDTVLFQDSGAASFPFTRIAGTQIEMGCAAAGAVAVLDNTLFWLGASRDGAGVVYRADGLLPTRISTHAVEAAIQGYATIADAVAMTYQAEGHLFYCLHFPTANATWVYDVSAQMWHERGYWNTAAGTYTADLARYHAFGFGKHIVGDFSSGNIYELSTAFATDNGAPLRWLRAAPHLSNEESWLFYSSIQIDMETGGGLPSGADPQVMIRWSDDGGFTWSSYRQVSCGATGAYTRRAKLNRCGRARNRVFEVSGTDAIPRLALINAYLGVERGE